STSLQARPTRPALLLSSILFFLITRRLPGSTLFPYTTLFRSRWAHNGNRKVLALPRQNRFAQALRERISVGPTQVLRAAQAYVGQTVAHPARAVAAENALEFRRRRRSFVPASPQNVPAKRFAQFGTLRAR